MTPQGPLPKRTPTPKMIGYLKWRRKTHPEIFDALLAGRNIDSLDFSDTGELIGGLKKAIEQNIPIEQILNGPKDQKKIEIPPVDDVIETPKKEEKIPQNKDNKPRHNFRRGSLRALVADCLLANGVNETKAYRELRDYLGKPPLIFSRNVNGKREPAPAWEQREKLRRTVDEVARGLRRDNIKPDEQPQEQPKPKDPPKPKPPQVPDNQYDAKWFLTKIREARRYCERRVADGNPIDHVSMRWAVFGRKMNEVGIPYPAALHAATMHWPKDARQAIGVIDFDTSTIGKKIEGRHDRIGYCLKLVEGRVPTCLYGPAGGGKTTIAAQVAEILGLDFGMVPMTAGATPSWLTGAYTLDGYKSRPFVDIYRDGGVFLFDEMDAADPNMLLVVNSAIANGFFFNPTTGERIEKHENFVPIAAMNTLGLGANRQYTGRERLDAATLDRYRMGRVYIGIDEALEERLLLG